jgi:curved DNA-binding protein
VKDLYATLGVPRTASADEIKKAYRKLTRELHPDKNPGDKKAEDRFKDVSAAYDVVGDAEKRKLYDEFGDMSLTQGFDAERARAFRRAGGGAGPGFDFRDFGEARETSFEDLLSRLFGGGGGGRVRVEDFEGGFPGAGRRTLRRPGADLEGEVTVDFLAALQGTSTSLRIAGQDGASTLDVKVPAGVADGGRLRLRGQGGPGDPPGDVLLTVRVRPHPILERVDRDLEMRLPVTALEAHRGGPIDVPTPWGPVTVKIPPGSQGGQKLRLRGKGVHGGNAPDGDLFVTLEIRLPRTPDDALVERLEALQGRDEPRRDLKL